MSRSWNAVIDMSNVCRDRTLPPSGDRTARWRRLEMVIESWRDLHGRDASVALVADDSLGVELRGDDRRRFRRLLDAGEIHTAPVADPVLLELADRDGLHVISRDKFVDQRRDFPWIERRAERFHRWTPRGGGRVGFRPAGIEPVPEHVVSRAREAKEIRYDYRLDPGRADDRRILRTRWKCGDELGCYHARLWQDQLLTWPSLTGDRRVVCPGCGGPLTDLGPRDACVEMILTALDSGAEITRFPLEADVPVVVGRGRGMRGINLATVDPAHALPVSYVSRQHLMLRLEAPGGSPVLSAADLGSSHGTTVERTGGGPRPLTPGEEIRINSGDRLVLSESVVLRMSGRRFVTDTAIPESADQDIGQTSITTIKRTD